MGRHARAATTDAVVAAVIRRFGVGVVGVVGVIGLLVSAGCGLSAEAEPDARDAEVRSSDAGWQVVLTTVATSTTVPASTPATTTTAASITPTTSTVPIITPTTAPTTAPTTTPTTAGAPPSTTPSTTTGAVTAAASTSARTACTSVAHIGDSTSAGAIAPEYVPEPERRLDAQYARVGVTSAVLEISPGRSVVETRQGQANAYDTALAIRAGGFEGCWVVAIGTNDAANIGAGAMIGAAERIDRIMSVVGADPVLWVDTVTFTDEGPWARVHMDAWNAALREATARHPSMRIYEWSAVARPEWFTTDGIHDNGRGATLRAALFADALAATFPDTASGD